MQGARGFGRTAVNLGGNRALRRPRVGVKSGHLLAPIGDEDVSGKPVLHLVEHGHGLAGQPLFDEEIDLLQVGQKGVIRSGRRGLVGGCQVGRLGVLLGDDFG